MSILDILSAPWAIMPNHLEQIRDIYASHLRGEGVNLQELEARLQRELQRAAAARDGALALPDAVVALGLLRLPEAAVLQRCGTALATRRVEVEGLARQAAEAAQARQRAATPPHCAANSGGLHMTNGELRAQTWVDCN